MNYELGIKEIVLSIDTSSNKEIVVGLRIDGKSYEKREEIGVQKSQVVLPLVEEILAEHHLDPTDITSIEVAQGPGSFTGLRVGISIANALAYSLTIPVNGKPIGDFAEPVYE